MDITDEAVATNLVGRVEPSRQNGAGGGGPSGSGGASIEKKT